MNILMVSGAIPNPRAHSGSALVLAGQLAGLATRHTVTLVTFAPADAAEQSALARWRASGVVVHVAGEAIPAGLIRLKRALEKRLNRLRNRHPLSHLTGPNPRMQRVVDRVLLHHRFDLVQAENFRVGTCRYPSSIPKVLTEHGVNPGVSAPSDELRRSQPEIWRQFDRVQVFTPRDAVNLVTVAPDLADRVRVNPFGIDLPPAPDLTREDPATVGFVGGFNHAANVDAAVWLAREIMPLLRTRHPRARLLLVGADPPAAVRALARPDTVVTGAVPAVEPYLEQAAIIVAPVRFGGGMRVKVLHALAMGKSVVTTRLGAEGLAGPADQLPLALAETAEQFADEASFLLSCLEARRELGQRARTFVARHHSWSAYAQRLEAIYAELWPR